VVQELHHLTRNHNEISQALAKSKTVVVVVVVVVVVEVVVVVLVYGRTHFMHVWFFLCSLLVHSQGG